jgi:hypothetical protein
MPRMAPPVRLLTSHALIAPPTAPDRWRAASA